MKYRIPIEFLTVVKKMVPEIDTISIIDVQTISLMNPGKFQPESHYTVYVELILSNESNPPKSHHDYSNTLKDLFSHVYPHTNFIEFRVNRVNILNKLTNEQIFAELFIER